MKKIKKHTMLKKFALSLLLLLPALAFSQSINYQWSTGDTTSTISPSPLVTTTYYVTITQYGVSYEDSVTIVVNQATSSTQTQTACNSYVWPINNQTYSSTGLYYDTLLNSNNCDSIITLDLTIQNSNSGGETITACDTFLWSANNQVYYSSGTYVDTLQNVYGCDSVATLQLTINLPKTNTVTNFLCPGAFEILSNGDTVSQPGTYPVTYTGANSCDSIVDYVYQGPQEFLELTNTGLPNLQNGDIQLGDMNGDGTLDVVFAAHTGNFSSTKVYFNNGSGQFTENTSAVFEALYQ